jgi:hypothetical protein
MTSGAEAFNSIVRHPVIYAGEEIVDVFGSTFGHRNKASKVALRAHSRGAKPLMRADGHSIDLFLGKNRRLALV